MKNKLFTLAVLVFLSTIINQISTCFAQGTAFTYQGRLNDGGNAYSGNAEFEATLWSVPSGGIALATNSPVLAGVTNGLFVLPLDFGGNFSGGDRWLQLGVRTNQGAFSTLVPRQQITATPYAIYAAAAGSAATATTANAVANNGVASGAIQTGAVGATQIADGSIGAGDLSATVLSNTFWRLGGNAGTTPGPHFLGTTDNQPLEFKVNGLRALRLEDNGDSDDPGATPDGAPNVIGGSPRNFVGAGVVGAVIAGGGATIFGFVAYTNSVSANFGVVGGGLDNAIQTNADYSTIGGGRENTIQTNAVVSTIGGGLGNTIQTDAIYSTIGGGLDNTIQTGTIYSTIGGGQRNTIETSADFSTIGGGNRNTIQTDAGDSTIGGGLDNTIQANASVATIGGGLDNTIQANASVATIGGGLDNTIQTNADYATIPGGDRNSATNRAFAAGTRAKANHRGSFVWADSTDADFTTTGDDQFLVRASGGVGFSTGGAERLRINSAGSVAIGIPGGSSDAALHVQNTIGSRPIKCDRVSADGQLLAWARDDTVVGDVTVAAGVVSYNAFTGSHYAWLPQPLEYGTLVALTGDNRRPNKEGEIVYGVTPTSRANDPACLGAYLAPHRNEEPAATTDQHQIMSVGNGEMWVTQSDAGDIRPGDSLISSEVAGCAMKDDPAQFPVGHVCARAAEAVKWSAVPAGANGRKEMRISVLLGNFVRDSRGAAAQHRSEALAQELKARLEKLERLINEKNGVGK